MKKLSKNILMVLICFMLIFSLHIVRPHEKAKADFGISLLAIGGITLATLAIGGLSHLAINEDARKAVVDSSVAVFNNATDSVKQDFTNAIERTKLYGGIGLELAGATWDWIQNVAIKSITSDLFKKDYFKVGPIEYNAVNLLRTFMDGRTYGVYEFSSYIISDGIIFKGLMVEMSGDALSTRGLARRRLITDLNITSNDVDVGTWRSTVLSNFLRDDNGVLYGYTGYLNSLIDMDKYIPVDHWANQVGNSLDRVFEASRSRGKLDVPLDGLMGVGDGSVGLHYDLSANRWLVSQTGEHWLGDVALDLNQIGVVTDASTGAIAYNPDLDIPRVGIRDVTGTITDPITGDHVGTIETDIPIDGSFPIDQTDAPPIDIPVPPPSIPGQINWDKLKYSGDLFTTAFPFSLPWDIANALDATFGGLGNTSVPDFDFKLKNLNGEIVALKIVIPDAITNQLPFVRAVFLIIFDISIIYAIRRLLGGAS